MKLIVVVDEGRDIYLADEETGSKVTNFMVEQYNFLTNNRLSYRLGSKDADINLGAPPELTMQGRFSEAAVVYKTRIFVVAQNYRDFKSYCESNNVVPNKSNAFGEVVCVTKPQDLAGYRVRQYFITPHAIHNEKFSEIVEVLKAGVK